MRSNTDEWHITTAWPPTVNHYLIPIIRNGRHSKRLSAEGQAFNSVVALHCMQLKLNNKKIQGKLAVELVLRKPRRVPSWDVDNRIKPVLDALEHAGVYGNDSQVRCVLAYEGPGAKNNAGATHIRIVRWEGYKPSNPHDVIEKLAGPKK